MGLSGLRVSFFFQPHRTVSSTPPDCQRFDEKSSIFPYFRDLQQTLCWAHKLNSTLRNDRELVDISDLDDSETSPSVQVLAMSRNLPVLGYRRESFPTRK